MKKKLTLLSVLMILTILPLPVSSALADFDPLAFLEEAVRRAVHQIRVSKKEETALPKVINHINFPDEYPDFAFSGEDDLLEIWFPSMRDQDAAIFLYQGQVWMIDCGDERASSESVPLLRYLGVDQIDRLFNTHPHHDHLNGLYAIDASFPVKELMICFPEDSTKHMTAAMEYCKGNIIPVTQYGDEDVFPMGDGLVSFLSWQKSDESESINDRSAQFMVSYGGCSIFFMADMETRGQKQLYEALGPAPLKADILRYPHHGKKYMLDSVFQAINPALAIITNSSRIPEIRESTRYLDYRHIPIAFTRRAGYILHLTCDGRRWLCEEMLFDASPYMNAASPDGGSTIVISSPDED